MECAMISSLPTRLSWVAAALGIGLLAVLAGVGGGDLSRVSIAGKMSVDGVPLSQGTIGFVAMSGSQPVTDASLIREGGYLIASSETLVPGKYQVRISGLGPQAVVVPTDQLAQSGLSSTNPQEPLPARYNDQTVLTVEIPGRGYHTLNFDLKR
jgi:hypothetical protein